MNVGNVRTPGVLVPAFGNDRNAGTEGGPIGAPSRSPDVPSRRANPRPPIGQSLLSRRSVVPAF